MRVDDDVLGKSLFLEGARVIAFLVLSLFTGTAKKRETDRKTFLEKRI